MTCSRVRLLVPAVYTALVTLGPSHAAAQESGRALLRQMYGDVAVVVHSGPAATVRVGTDDGTKTVTITLLARDLRRWADSAAKILTARPRGRGEAARWRAIAEGPGVAAGSMTLSRSLSGQDTTITFFMADAQFESIRTDITPAEARTLVRAMRRAANVVLAPGRRGGGAAPAPGSGRAAQFPP